MIAVSMAFATNGLAIGPTLESGTVAEAALRLKPGEFLWAPQVAPAGPVLVVVGLKTQRALVYRNGIPIGISTVSTGRPGYETPTGVFVILQKRVEHYSNLYDNAPMPYMQRLTWGGIALHAGKLPGYPASHGCIRLPNEFARLLYQITQRGMTVVITDRAELPRLAPAETLLASVPKLSSHPGAPIEWNPALSPSGPISIVVSHVDQRLVVLRNGIRIGSSPVEIAGKVARTSAYLLNGVKDGNRVWVRIGLPGQDNGQPENLKGRVRVPEDFRSRIDPLIKIGTTVIVTGDSLGRDTGTPITVIETDPLKDGGDS